MTVGHQLGPVERLILQSLPLCILLFLVSVDYARAADPNQASNNYIRTRFADDDGLPNNLVENMVFWSEAGSGTEVELTVPAAKAYAKPVSFFLRKRRD